MNDVSHTVKPPLTATSPLYNGHFLQSLRWTLYRGATVVFATSPESKLSYEAFEPSILRANALLQTLLGKFILDFQYSHHV